MGVQDIFRKVAQVEEQIGELYSEIGELKKELITLIDANKNLTIENHHLRERLNQEYSNDSKLLGDEKFHTAPGEGYDNLARLYQEGFHVCNINYGSIRVEGDCLLCLNFLKFGSNVKV